MGTKLQELRDGCFARAMDDEPMFVLLSRDPSAPALVRQWADQRTGEVNAGTRPASDMEQILEARGCADRMEAWREANDGAWRNGLFGESVQETTLEVGDNSRRTFG
jgi:hypothetical protein